MPLMEEDVVVISDSEEMMLTEESKNADPEARRAAARKWQMEVMGIYEVEEEDDAREKTNNDNSSRRAASNNTEESAQVDFTKHTQSAPAAYGLGKVIPPSSSSPRSITHNNASLISVSTSISTSPSKSNKKPTFQSTLLQQPQHPTLPAHSPPPPTTTTKTTTAPHHQHQHQHQHQKKPAQQKPTLPSKYAIKACKRFGLDDGSMDAFIDSDFDKGLPLAPPPHQPVIGNRGGRAPVANMYDPMKIISAKQHIKSRAPLESCVEAQAAASARLLTCAAAAPGGKAATGFSRGRERSVEEPVGRQVGGNLVRNSHSGLREGCGGGTGAESSQLKQAHLWVEGVEEDRVKETAPKCGFAALVEQTKAASVEGERRADRPKSSSAAATDKNDAPLCNNKDFEELQPEKPAPAPPPQKKTQSSSGIKISTNAPSSHKTTFAAGGKKQKNNNTPGYDVTSVLRSSQKRTLSQLEVGTLFYPDQIISEAQLERKKKRQRQRQRQRHAPESEKRAQYNSGRDLEKEETLVFDTDQTIISSSAEVESKERSQHHRLDSKQRVPITSEPKNDQIIDSVDIPADPIVIGSSPTSSNVSLFEDADDAFVAIEEEEQGDNDASNQERNAFPTAVERTLLPLPPSQMIPDQIIQQANIPHDATNPPAPHPTTSRKTISPQMLAAFKATAAAAIIDDPTATAGSAENEENPSPIHEPYTTATSQCLNRRRAPLNSFREGEILYQYHITRSDFGPVIPETRAVMTIFGPYYSLSEANEGARMETGRSYKDMFATEQLEGRRANLGKEEEEGESLGNEVSRVSDGVGCQTWRCVRFGGRGVVARVERGIAPRDFRITSIPDRAFRIPRKVWVALQFLNSAATPAQQSDPDEHQLEADQGAEEGEFVTLGAFTTPDLANKRAGQAILEFRSRRGGNRERDRVKKLECEMAMRRLLKKLDEDEQCFDQEVVMEDKGVGRVWVVKVGVEGPRN